MNTPITTSVPALEICTDCGRVIFSPEIVYRGFDLAPHCERCWRRVVLGSEEEQAS